jgi:tRNA(Ile)-lysidine synthase
MITNSGGQDSTVLLLFISVLQNQYKYNLFNIYCNHLWQRSSLQLIIHLSRIHFIHKIHFIIITPLFKLINENLSRNWRYNTLARLASFSSFEYTLVAHTSTDQIESFFLNICRGAGPVGLTTLKTEQINFYKKYIGFTDKKKNLSNIIFNVKFIFVKQYNLNYKFIWSFIWRPLIVLNRFEIQKLYKVLNLPIWTDKTNYNLNYRRNRIRFELLPYLRFYFNSKVDVAILRCIENIAAESKFIKKITQKAFKTSIILGAKKQIIIHDYSQLYQYPSNIKKNIIIDSLNKLNIKGSNFSYIQFILKCICLMKQYPKYDKPKIFYLSNILLICFYGNYLYLCRL